MNEFKHVAGPWTLVPGKFGYMDVDAKAHRALAQVVWRMEGDDRTAECEANAHLIAAAPDLLNALKKAVDALNTARKFRVNETDSYAIAALCDAVIAKAEGKKS